MTIPKHAIEVVPGKVFWLGTAVEKGRLVEGYAIIHHKIGVTTETIHTIKENANNPQIKFFLILFPFYRN